MSCICLAGSTPFAGATLMSKEFLGVCLVGGIEIGDGHTIQPQRNLWYRY